MDLTEKLRNGCSKVKVLLVDTEPERARLLEAHLASAGVTETVRPQPGEPLPIAIARTAPDLVIVDMARPDRDTLDDILRATHHDPRPVAMFVDVDDPAFMEAAVEAGVSSYTVVGAALPDVKPILRTAVAIFRRYRQVEADLHRAEASLRQRVLMDEAKRFLMKHRRMSEPEAHRWLRRRAMERSRRVVDIATELLGAAEGEGSCKDD
ncbi:ANTAR domain-containing protein [Siccirubricoccus sp. KC 17139]|uniref:ANTAR domain-containing protein n=1 Tax=Siccirubricoccus soli TaxID=2899147 RepID=A0ABT1D954_9PROT|nr:ANTAR domain-containing protein [Siccirubricoccus soli]MCO6418463.1 ANTAR domain-containing protein [Siccirubricoccus soli]MCP2684598.1 ANTAR domain-containing protein [Siccirubricoccus soli]